MEADDTNGARDLNVSKSTKIYSHDLEHGRHHHTDDEMRIEPFFARGLSATARHVWTSIKHKGQSEESMHHSKSMRMKREDLRALYDDESVSHLTSFERLQHFHQIARIPVMYNANAPLRIFLHFARTGVQMVSLRPMFWVLMGFHLTMSLVYFSNHDELRNDVPLASGWPKVSLALIAVPGSIIAFMLVFYLNQTYAAYLDKWNQLIGACGALHDLVLLLRVHLADHVSPDARAARHSLCKIANALHFLAYVNLPNNRTAKIDEWGWWFVEKNRLLTPGQVDELRPMAKVHDGSTVHRHALMWIDRSIWALHDKHWYVPHVATLFSNKIFDLRTRLDNMYTHPSSPIPFAYYHLLNFVVIVYLFVFGYAATFSHPFLSIVGYFLLLIIVLGIREIGNAMSQPVKNEELDIPIFFEAYRMLQVSLVLMSKGCAYPDELEGVRPTTNYQGQNVFDALDEENDDGSLFTSLF